MGAPSMIPVAQAVGMSRNEKPVRNMGSVTGKPPAPRAKSPSGPICARHYACCEKRRFISGRGKSRIYFAFRLRIRRS
jgi:hypothetical protein